jgi:hypothetical protein
MMKGKCAFREGSPVKKLIGLVLIAIPFLGACVFDVPVTTKHDIPVDQVILGSWETVPVENEDPAAMRIFRFSDTEYIVHYYEDDGDLYFRAWAMNIGGVYAMQLELIGDEDSATSQYAEDRYMVAAYRMLDGKLEVKTLNSDLINPEITDSKSLEAEILKYRDNPQLFNDPGLFQRSKD